MKKAALYARVSSDLQRKEKTIESQVAELKKQIEKNGDILVKEYIDDGHSGAKLDRPGLEQLRKDLKMDVFEVIYFLNTDRIAREVTYQTIIIGEILKQNKQIIINGKDYIHNPENKFTLTVLGAVAELERAKIMERYTRGRMHKIRNGFLLSHGHKTYGYDYIPKGLNHPMLVINQKEAKTVRYIFKAFVNDKASKSGIIRYLEKNKIQRKNGSIVWDWKGLENILKNSTYMGIKYFNTRTMIKETTDPIRKIKYGKEVFKDRSEWLPVKVPPIIPKELFEKAQKRFDENKKKYINPNEAQLLSNLVKCGLCGGSCTAYKRYVRGYKYSEDKKGMRTGKIYHRVSYVCSRRIRQKLHAKDTGIKRCSNPQIAAHRLESSVFLVVKEIMTDATRLKEYLINFNVKKEDSKLIIENQLDDIENKIIDLVNKKRETLESYAKGKINRTEYSELCHGYDNELKVKKAKKDELLLIIPSLYEKSTVDLCIDSYCNNLKIQIKKSIDFNSKRIFLLNYIKQIVLTNGKASIHGSIPINSHSHVNSDHAPEVTEIGFVI